MESGSDSKRVLIVEDQALIAFALQRLIARIDAGMTTRTCGCPLSALEMLQGGSAWHRVFLAPDMRGAEGMSLARRVRALGLADRCVLVTRTGNPAWMHEAKESGMLGYLLSTIPVERFECDLRAVLEGRRVFAPIAASYIRLTRRQEEILELLRGGFSSKQIAARLEISEGTVNNHVAALIRIFGVSNRTQAITRAIELGYLRWQSR